jgi:hypothetical protein
VLFVQNNPLTFLPEGLLNGLGRLRNVHLADNHLISLPSQFFRENSRLQLLFLENNCLTSLPADLFEQLPDLQALYLSGNPRLLVCNWGSYIGQGNLALRETMRGFYGYTCRSSLARVYQMAAGNASLDVVRSAFGELPDSIKNAIFEKVRVEAGRPQGDSQWSRIHAFDDRGVFGGALKRYVRESFEGLSQEQKNAVYSHVSTLARSQPGAEAIDFSDPRWGENHALDNLVRLIDAMSQLSLE